jgi:hypothetical protein
MGDGNRGMGDNTPLPPPLLPSQGEGEPPHWAHRRAPLHPHTTTGVREWMMPGELLSHLPSTPVR